MEEGTSDRGADHPGGRQGGGMSLVQDLGVQAPAAANSPNEITPSQSFPGQPSPQGPGADPTGLMTINPMSDPPTDPAVPGEIVNDKSAFGRGDDGVHSRIPADAREAATFSRNPCNP
eukprot:7742980-Pyramimonas_sp.AAC.1